MRTRTGVPRLLTWHEAFTLAVGQGDAEFLVHQYAVPFGHPLRYDLAEAISALVGRPSRYLVLFHLLAALLILALPHTRAIAKVRPIHLLRAVTYPIVLTVVLFYMGVMIEACAENVLLGRRRGLWISGPWIEAFLISVGLFYAFWWWRMVCTRYLKLPSPHLVWAITMGVALFGTTVLPPVNAALFHKLLFGY